MRIAIFITAMIMTAAGALAQTPSPVAKSVVNSPHNLSVTGPGAIRAATEPEICIFCHTPHSAAPIQPLWNRATPMNAYMVYASPSLKAMPGQPTGSSKLCLSCHDGTIALGSVLSRTSPIVMAGGITTIPPGVKNLGTDLRDDHPLSFQYNADLVSKNPKLKSPIQLPEQVRLDRNLELQCTACHNPHDNGWGNFLVMDNSSSQLCNACHRMGLTSVPNHAQCAGCHRMHTAPSGPYLLKSAKVTDTCLACHSGGTTGVQGPNIGADLAKRSKHDTAPTIDKLFSYPMDVSCVDCHEAHTMKNGTLAAPTIPANFGSITGVTAAGGKTIEARFEYEVCFKCHADQSAVQPGVPRQIIQNNTRLQFDKTAISFHPVQIAGKNPDVPSLKAPLTTSSIIYCSDCHSADSGHKGGGTGPDGTHGSTNAPLLMARYDTVDDTTESPTVYALCYRCHERTVVLSDQSFKLHNKHVVTARAPCSVCHTSHGISSTQGTMTKNAHLMNFDTTVVRPVNAGGVNRMEYQSLGVRSGRCFLTCHGVDHAPKEY